MLPSPHMKRTSGAPLLTIANLPSTRDQITNTPKEQLHILWRDLVQTQRVHEMIKCLQAEKRKLKILHSHAEENDDFLDFAAARVAARHDVKVSSLYGEERTEADQLINEGGELDEAEIDKEGDGSKSPGDKKSSTKLQRPYSSPMRSISASQFKPRLEVLANKAAITDEEFEDIVELCEDKIEQKALREAFEQKKAREKYLHNADEKRIMLYNFINSRFIANFMLLTIITSIVGIFLLTFENIAIRYAWPLVLLDSCIIGIFLVEAILKIIIYKGDYFQQLWNLLDVLIIIVHFVEVVVDLITRTLALSTDINASIGFKFLKSLRALRLLRVIKFLPNLQVIVATVFQSMLSIGSIAVLMSLFIFVFTVMGRGLFYERLPHKFGNLWLSFVTLFQLLTLDDWFTLMSLENDNGDTEEYEDISEGDDVGYWLMFCYLFAYLVIEFFVFLNLFVAVLVDNFQLTLADAEIQKQREAEEELAALKKFEDLKDDGIDPIIKEEEHQQHKNELEQLGLHVEDYFPLHKDSKEAELLTEFYKDLNSLDFQRFLWKRRNTFFNMITDAALHSRQNATIIHEESESEPEEEKASKTQVKSDESVHRRKKRRSVEVSDEKQKKINAMHDEYLPSRYSFEI